MDDSEASTEVADATAAFLAEYDGAASALEAALAADEGRTSWTFDDVALDSGTFGELVSRGVVEKVDGEYRVVAPETVETVLTGDSMEREETGSASTGSTELPDRLLTYARPATLRRAGRSTAVALGRPGRSAGRLADTRFGCWGDGRALAALVGALALVVVMRVVGYGSVIREDHVVSPENDPYHYRYFQQELLDASSGPTDWSVLAEMPSGAESTRPFTHAANWWLTEALGGSAWAADVVTAWLPVASSVVVAVLLYAIAVSLTRDPRIGLTTVLLFAITPTHAVYSGIGFLEHRPHQYLWLAVTTLGLLWFALDAKNRWEGKGSAMGPLREQLFDVRTWVVTLVLGVGFGVSAHIWGGTPLLFIPVALYVALRVPADVRARISPLAANASVILALAVGGSIAWAVHARWEWHEAFVALTPLLVLAGTIAVCVMGEAWRRYGWSTRSLLGAEGVVGATGFVLFRWLRADDWERIVERFDDLWFRDSTATETLSLFSPEMTVVLGPIQQIGVEFYLAMAVLGWAVLVSYRRYEPAWLLMSVFTGYLTLLATLQMRFAAQLALFVSVMGGIGFVVLLWKIGLARPVSMVSEDGGMDGRGGSSGSADRDPHEPSIRVPESVSAGIYLVLVFMFVIGLGLIFTVSFVGQVSYSDGEYEAMTVIEEHADETDRLESSEDYVLTDWGDTRMYNYFVSGDSQSYGYDQRHFGDFRADEDPDSWYDEEFDGEVGYVVLTDVSGEIRPEITQARLHGELGTATDEHDALEHYQVLFVDDHHDAVAAAAVSGATINATVEPEETVTVATDVEVDGASFTYEQEATADEDGELSTIVAYPGEYDVGETSVTVAQDDVLEGETISIE